MLDDLLRPAFSALASAARPLLARALLAPFRSLFSDQRASPLARVASATLTPGPGTLRHRTRMLQAYDTAAKGDVERLLPATPPPVEQAPQGPTLQRGVWMRDSLESPAPKPPTPARVAPMPSVTLPPVPRAGKLRGPPPTSGGTGSRVPTLPRPHARGGRAWLVPVPASAYATPDAPPPQVSSTRSTSPTPPRTPPPTRPPITGPRTPPPLPPKSGPRTSPPTVPPKAGTRTPPPLPPKPGTRVAPTPPPKPPKPPRLRARSGTPTVAPTTAPPTVSVGPSAGTRMRALAVSGVVGAPIVPSLARAQGQASAPSVGPSVAPVSPMQGPSLLGRARSASAPPTFGRVSLGAPQVMLGGALIGGAVVGGAVAGGVLGGVAQASPGASGTERSLMASRELSQRLDATFSRRASAPPTPSFLDQSRTLSDRLDEVARSVKPRGPAAETGAARHLRESRELSDRLDEALIGLKGKKRTESSAEKMLRESRELSDRLDATLRDPEAGDGPKLTKSEQDMQATRELSERLDGAFRKPEGQGDGLTDTERDLRQSRALSERLGSGFQRGRSGMSRLVPLSPLLGGGGSMGGGSSGGGLSGGAWVGGSTAGLTRGTGPQLGRAPSRPRAMRDDTHQVVLPEGLRDVELPRVDPEASFEDLQRGELAWRRRQAARGFGADEFRRRARKGGVSPGVENELVAQYERVLEQRDLAPLVKRDPRAKTRFEQLTRELQRDAQPRLSSPEQRLTSGGPQPTTTRSGGDWGGRRAPTDKSSGGKSPALIGQRTPSSRNLAKLDDQETVQKDDVTRSYRDRAEDRLRDENTVLGDVLSGEITTDDLTENRDLRRYLIADLVLKEKKFGRLEPEEDKLKRRWNENLGTKDEDDDDDDEPTLANAPTDLKPTVKPHWVAGSMLARRARSAWWPTWVRHDVAPIEGARLARRFAQALRIVELRAKPTLTSDERSELQLLSTVEDRALRADGSALVLDRLLGRKSLQPHELPSGYGGSDLRLSQTDEALAKKLKGKKGTVDGGGEQVLLTGGGARTVTGGGAGITAPRRMRGKMVGRQRGTRSRSNAFTTRALDQATHRALDGGPPPGFPMPKGGFIRGGVDAGVLADVTARSRDGRSGLDQLDRLDDEGLARLLSAVLADPDAGGRVLERALATLKARARLGRMREIRG